ncbi:type I-E CRISPR-associated protein Cas6/Cse3/CasE [Actinomadura sp. DC4]|uniref:type I-E CRISPR-associated protein Cas6/Cse3/CasE n=1 Tax=Actinomadura sp. DC4 TaxID=3055069 RepID=UPI0025AEE04F|nr:type I-E CRISPR-associated protein Cas6/Cse3/CasE [Actinomadura sp. DC4]MDN3357338.1 type I-E CRISPR-associated protein Cas6/Cse3/CasE [Actinomadura sp. DC4]
MYLTRFRVNTQRVPARRLLSSPQMLHAAVLSSFAEPPTQNADGPRVLWRLDRNSNAETHLFIVSPDKPDLTHLVEQAGWPTTGGWQTLEYAPFLSRLTKGDRWAFRLTANPVHSIRRTDKEPTKVTAHVTPRHQMQWLLDRQEKAGFTIAEKPQERRLTEGDVHELIVHDRRQIAFKKKGNTRPVSLATATFDGRLEITDPDTFRRTLTSGIGRAKAYGCGLMTLARA